MEKAKTIDLSIKILYMVKHIVQHCNVQVGYNTGFKTLLWYYVDGDVNYDITLDERRLLVEVRCLIKNRLDDFKENNLVFEIDDIVRVVAKMFDAESLVDNLLTSLQAYAKEIGVSIHEGLIIKKIKIEQSEV